MAPLQKSATCEQRIARMKSLAGTVPAEEIAKLCGWKKSTLTSWAHKLSVKLRCEEGEKIRAQRTLSSRRINQAKAAKSKKAIDVGLWRIPQLPHSAQHTMGNFT